MNHLTDSFDNWADRGMARANPSQPSRSTLISFQEAADRYFADMEERDIDSDNFPSDSEGW